MKKVVQRLLTFFVGVPAVVALVLFLPYYRHLPLNIVVTIFCGIGAVEFSSMLKKKQLFISKPEAFILGALPPAMFTLVVSFGFSVWLIPFVIMLCSAWVLLSRTFSRLDKMDTVANHLAAGFSVLVYPGFFMCWLIYMSIWENSGAILLFLMIVFGSDSAAWLAGSIFGANNRGIVAASPNKSVAGFIGGIIGSIIVSGGAALLFPFIFSPVGDNVALWPAILLGFFTSVIAELGDLAESAIKRSCDTKDSGRLMFGRGGVLDSIDSIAAASPVFFLLFNIFFVIFFKR